MKTPSPSDRGDRKDFRKDPTPIDERPLRICVVFDEVASARSAEVLITHVTADYICDRQAFRFDELNAPKPSIAAARKVADADILVLAARGDQVLPSHVRLWLGLCLGLRDDGQEGALVALITNVDGCEGLHSSILDYLETIAIIGGGGLFPPDAKLSHNLEGRRENAAKAKPCYKSSASALVAFVFVAQMKSL